MSIQSRQNRIVWLLVPIVGVLLIFRIFPIFLSFVMSFYNWSVFQSEWAGLDNYAFFLKDTVAKRSLLNTFYYAALHIPTNIALALVLALLINRTNAMRSFFRMAHFLPLVMSMVAASILWKWIYQPQFGLLSAITSGLGLGNYLWLRSPQMAMPSVVIFSVWKGVGFNTVIFMAGLTAIPTTFYEAGIVNGASTWQKFRFITWPLLRPTLLFVAVVSLIGSLQVFTQVYIMTEGGPQNATRVHVQYMRDTAFLNLELGYGAALAFILFVIILIITLIQLRLLRTRWEY